MTQNKEEFEKWFQGEQGKPYDGMYMFALAAWQARQPEIDALNAKLESREAQMETVGSIERDLRNELARLKAENERLRYLKDNFVRCEPKMDGKHHWIAKGRLIGSGNTFEEAIVALMKETK